MCQVLVHIYAFASFVDTVPLSLLFICFERVSGMAEWLRHSLAKWKVPGSNLTMGKVSVKSFKKKRKAPAIL